MSKLKHTSDALGKGVMFWCPGCQDEHPVRIQRTGTEGAVWTWNGSDEKPTFSPSVFVRNGHYAPGHQNGDECWCTWNRDHPENPAPFHCYACHSFVTDGRIQFLGDCTHALAGQTVDLPDWED